MYHGQISNVGFNWLMHTLLTFPKTKPINEVISKQLVLQYVCNAQHIGFMHNRINMFVLAINMDLFAMTVSVDRKFSDERLLYLHT